MLIIILSLSHPPNASITFRLQGTNIGINTTLLPFELTQDINNMNDELSIEKNILFNQFGMSLKKFSIVDGIGGGEIKASNLVVTKWLDIMHKLPALKSFVDVLPTLTTDVSLAFFTDFQNNLPLRRATGQIKANVG